MLFGLKNTKKHVSYRAWKILLSRTIVLQKIKISEIKYFIELDCLIIFV